ncbi:MAG: hypothetical protein FWG45_01860 [Oscillospiraceae bacterium]|nr:hypothetical protein [Oscillospiraceae bacterium]
MANTAETIRELSRKLTINEILLASKDYTTLEEFRKYLENLLEGANG